MPQMSNIIRNEMETKWKVILYQFISTLNSVKSLFGTKEFAVIGQTIEVKMADQTGWWTVATGLD